jgi:coiled-coil domain-containing protein 77
MFDLKPNQLQFFLFCKADLADQKKITEDYRSQLLSLESQMDSLRDQSNANKEVLKSRTKGMVDQVDSLKNRYEGLENRRKTEAEGYQSDVNMLKQKLRQVEQQLVRATLAKTKGT